MRSAQWPTVLCSDRWPQQPQQCRRPSRGHSSLLEFVLEDRTRARMPEGLEPRTGAVQLLTLPSRAVDRYELIELTAGGGAPGGGAPGGGVGVGLSPPPPPGGGVGAVQGGSSNTSDGGGGGSAAGPVIGIIIALAVVGGFAYWYTKVRLRTHSTNHPPVPLCAHLPVRACPPAELAEACGSPGFADSFVPTPQVRGKAAGPGAPPEFNAPPPPPPPPMAPSNLPPGWAEGTDPASGQSYYFNSNTGQTQWTQPTY